MVVGNSTLGNSIYSNSIWGNSGLGIDLGDNGVTPNHTGGDVIGPNGLQNYPVIDLANSSAGATLLEGTLDGDPDSTFRLQSLATPLHLLLRDMGKGKYFSEPWT